MIRLADGGTAYGKGFINGKLADPDLQEILWSYKRRVAGNYRPILPEEIGLLPPSRYLVSEKLDGELWFLVVSHGSVCLVNPYGRVIHGDLPILAQTSKLEDGLILAGELYIRVPGNRSRVGDLAHFFANSDADQGSTLSFCAFDVVRSVEAVEQQAYNQRHSFIGALFNSSQQIHPVSHTELETSSEIASLFAEKVLSGKAEGLIVRLPTGLIYKVKPVIEIDAVIIAFTSRLDASDQVRSMLLALAVDDERFKIIGACGNLGTDDQRASLLKQLTLLKCDSSVRVSSETGGLYQFVKPSIVVQVKVTDLQTDRSDGSPSLGHLISLREKGWASHGMYPTARLIHPVLMRVREDKEANSQDVRISQLDGYVSISRGTGHFSAAQARSEVLRREVWAKESKGAKAVRKLVVWKTNKEVDNPSMPAYVVHWTDYSPSRANPLDREVKLAPTSEIADRIADQFVSENIKKGWEPV